MTVTANREIEILSKVKEGPNLVYLFGINSCEYNHDKSLCAILASILEYCRHDLQKIIENKEFKLTASMKKGVIQDLTRGLDFLHEKGVSVQLSLSLILNRSKFNFNLFFIPEDCTPRHQARKYLS